MLLGLLLLALAVPSSAAPVFPEGFCTELPRAEPGLAAWIAGVDHELGRGPVHVLPEDDAVALFARAADAGWGSVDLFTRDAFRRPCTLYLSRDVLRAVDDRFRLDLLTAVHGADQDGRPFHMTAMLGGRGRLLTIYDRGGIVYLNEREGREFGLGSRVLLATPGRGRLEEIEGLCAQVTLLGCVNIHSLVKRGSTITVRAGPFTTESQATPIERRDDALARD